MQFEELSISDLMKLASLYASKADSLEEINERADTALNLGEVLFGKTGFAKSKQELIDKLAEAKELYRIYKGRLRLLNKVIKSKVESLPWPEELVIPEKHSHEEVVN